MCAPNTDEDKLLEYLFHNIYEQLITCPTHKSRNTLDVVLTNYNLVYVDQVRQVDFSDDFYVLFRVAIRENPHSSNIEVTENIYSISQANETELSLELSQSLFFFFIPSDGNYFDSFHRALIDVLDRHIPKKRLKRRQLPSYYSSHSMHLRNQMTKIYRQLERSLNDNTKRQFMLTSEKLSQSLELDKVIFLNSSATDSPSARDCHKLIRSLSSSDLLPKHYGLPV